MYVCRRQVQGENDLNYFIRLNLSNGPSPIPRRQERIWEGSEQLSGFTFKLFHISLMQIPTYADDNVTHRTLVISACIEPQSSITTDRVNYIVFYSFIVNCMFCTGFYCMYCTGLYCMYCTGFYCHYVCLFLYFHTIWLISHVTFVTLKVRINILTQQ